MNLLGKLGVSTVGLRAVAGAAMAHSPPSAESAVLFENVRIFDGRSERLSAPSNVLVVGKVIQWISAAPIVPPAGAKVTRIADNGRTLTPGLIDAHAHLMFSTIPQVAVLTGDIGFVYIAAAKGAKDTVMRGFTSVRDLGGPVFGLKQGIDAGLAKGPRIWPSGAFVSQSGGHGDFRLPNELSARPDDFSFSERVGAAAIADSADLVRKRVRERLALGASQIKLMAGGGVSSSYDPLDVTQYTVPELRAAVEAAQNWGTCVTVHAYMPRAVRQPIEAGAKCTDHGQLLDDATAKLMAEKGIGWSIQPFVDDHPSASAEGSPNRIKQLQMYACTDTAHALAKKYGIKTAWGTDNLCSAANATKQGADLAKMVRWYTPAEVLKMATADNAELLQLSGPRSLYPGTLGVVEAGALDNLLLVDGNPIANVRLIEDPAKNFVVIVKDGRIFKNTAP